MINVVIVEDNNTIREGLIEFINDTNKFRCVADFSDCEGLIENLPSIKTDLILMDIELPGISGIEGIIKLKQFTEEYKIIILTIYSESENLFEALASGAVGYIEKKTPPSQMVKVIEEISEGKSPMNSFIGRKILSHFSKRKSAPVKRNNDALDKNEYDVLKNLVNGNSPKAIADKLQISSDSVHNHFQNIYKKLQADFYSKNLVF
ncbi:MAG: response regulator transcription factor [Melioribacteraceae bacterium]|nr:response regulator transcription factor [Melioribacteraceae bacterium]MCF8356880.1 response regulator transcription factor [Melioribacteraceae bacterium]MCF8420034.1 response regulator transcription factor [Melioribacteraceae bacterium]